MQSEPLNLYGDRLKPTTGQHGTDITSQRLDELDEACLAFVKQRLAQFGICQALDLGGASGTISRKMATMGASILLIDLTDQHQPIARFNDQLGRTAIHFVQQDVRSFTDWPNPIDCVYSQRMLGCIRYAEALMLLTQLAEKSSPAARFFLSTGGMVAEYGEDYPDRAKPVQERFTSFSPRMAEKHGIYAPECLYHEAELRQLALESGLAPVKSWTSPFGNPKLIARRDG